MRPPLNPVVVTGVGAITALGDDVDALWTAILEGRDGILPARRLTTPALAAQHAALWPDAGWTARVSAAARGEGALEPCAELAITAAREALRRAGLDGPWGREGRPPASRVALALGTSAGGILSRSAYELTPPADVSRRHRLLARSGFHVQTAAVAAALGVEGPRHTLSSACTSSAHAVAHAADLVASGRVDVALAGGADVAAEDVIAGFHAMGAIAPGPCAPFSEPLGMNVGEGAGFLVLESAAHARARGASPLAALLGYGLSADGHHATAPDPTGAGLARAIACALDDAGVDAAAIDYVNAHGTGTEANDPAEHRALCRALGERAARIPVSSTKSYLGHTLGAAGALELIVTILAMGRGVVPPTLHFTRPRGASSPADPVAEPAPRPHRCRVALSTNAAFGGANTALIVGAPDAAAERAAASAEPVVLLGAGALAAHGVAGLLAALRRGTPCFTPVDPAEASVPLPEVAGRVPPFALEALARGVDPRGLDPMTRELLAAAALSLRDAGLKVRGSLRERAGLYVGASRLPWESSQAFWGSIRERGFARASAPAFARIVMNAAAGEVAAALGLRGPQSLFAGGPGSGLIAAIHAAWALSERRDADLILAGAADEIGWGLLADHAFQAGAAEGQPVLGEGAACVALARASWAEAQGLRPIAAVAGAGLAGPRGLAGAIRQALAGTPGGAPVAQGEVDAIFSAADGRAASVERELAALREVFGARADAIPRVSPAPVLGASECLDALSLAAAAEALRAGEARAALVIAAGELGGSAALIFRRE